ncbi:hypothetical protein [Streptomyces sp. NPDC048188]|uniref:hypothetical protein n=1 Tax=Streptomyces sp. NPDC048188 TaxID=3155749 RepID=UPI00341AC485
MVRDAAARFGVMPDAAPPFLVGQGEEVVQLARLAVRVERAAAKRMVSHGRTLLRRACAPL